MTPRLAAIALGVKLDASLTEEAVRAAFKQAIRNTHPDTRSDEPLVDDYSLDVYKSARAALLRHLGEAGRLEDCTTCAGTGQQPTRSGGLIKCSSCSGEGVVRKKEVRRG